MSRTYLALLTLIVPLLPATAVAVVTQIDGTVVPLGPSTACPVAHVRCCMDVYDPGGVIDPIIDARIYPGIFEIPCPTGCDRSECGVLPGCEFFDVHFEVLGEGAGYHNSFGWYNVGDDVTDVANLHLVLDCRSGGMVICPDLTPRTATINFQDEFDLGVYDGGFIGMWLRTPELLDGGNDGDGCGSVGDTSNRIYYTEQSLNDDGDFVHYLVWESVTLSETYYFGFEDLFRGGDNDFEDMFFVAQGLVPPCDPQPEVCDNVDNDCDSDIDEDLTRECSSACGTGEEICTAGSWSDCDAPEPEPEVCDGVDNNCNGDVDEGLSQACASECDVGTEVCFFGAWVDCDAPVPDLEVCDNVDNDCDGDIDEGLTQACATVCGPGFETCSAGSWVGCDAPLPSDELCNGLDDDCDGDVDEFNPEGGSPCGTDVGECQMGIEECIAAEVVCTGERGPIDEVCNGLDDDCDGEPDEDNPGGGAPCGSDIGACEPGILTCVLGRFECEGSIGPEPEECNGIDDDCDGVIDDDLVRDCEAPCGPGNQICIDGEWGECQGPSGNPEVCNGRDDDCDGLIDEDFEDPICPEEGSICVDGECALPCATGEFPCPPDKICVDGFCVLGPCRDVECPEGQMCQEGECVDLCGAVQCSGGFVCLLGRCVEDNCYGLGCEPGQICEAGECVVNLCVGVVCAEGEFCRDGECISTCAGVRCDEGQVCRDGSCVDDPCSNVWCDDGRTCVEGECVADPCASVQCGTGRICIDGDCADDPCFHVTCPDEQICVMGNCYDETPPPPRRPDEYGLATGGGGLSCVASPTAPRAPWLGILVIVGLFLRLRRRRVRRDGVALSALLFISGAGLLTSGCEVDPYCFSCGDDGGADGDGDSDVDASPDGDLPDATVPDSCFYEGEEECDGRDNDCNGLVDEGFNTMIDPANCGDCGVICIVPHAFPLCVDGECAIERCDVGWVDLDRLPGNGCEYECLGSGTEVCDGIDNDCDGAADEDFDLINDVNNCGSCNRTCAFYHAPATCVDGDCAMGECDPGFVDLDEESDTGCEYNCSPSGVGETCDGQDNDCDGEVDEGITVETDPENCGACGRVCAFLNAAAGCSDGDCELGVCDDGWINLDTVPENGCEYPCPGVTVEICDGQDNNCDGVVDEDDPDVATSCGSDVGDCVPGVWVCRIGRLECEGGSSGLSEICDGADNDCDGTPDDGNPGGGARCGLTNAGACEYGTVTCTGGELICGGALIEPEDEICNNIDDDCDTETDEGVAPRSCSTDCGTGTERCSAGAWIDCTAPPELPDLCDSIDNDCDGTPDPGCPGVGPGEIWVEGNSSNTVFPSLAADGSSRAVVAYLDRRSGDARVRVSGTSNQGNSWNSPSDDRLDTNGSDVDAMSPVVAMANGRAYASWEDTRNGDRRSIYFRRSNDGGANWVSGETRLDVGLTGDSFDIDMAAVGSDVYVVWQEMDWDDRSRAIYLVSSDDNGVSFSAPVRVDNHPSLATGIAREPSVAAGPGGRVYVAFADNRAGPGAIFVNASDDSGATWLPDDVRVDPSGVEAESQSPVIVADGSGTVVVAWEDEHLDGVDTKWKIFAAVSTDHGDTFDPEERLDDDPLPHDSRDAAIAIDPAGSYVFVTWRDMRNGLADIYLQRLELSGLDWDSSSTRIDTDEDGVGNSTLPRVTAGADGRVWVVWEDDRSGQRDIYLNFSLDWGDSYQPVDVRLDSDLPGDADSHDPRVAVTADRAIVVWVDHRAGSGTVGDIYARYVE